MKILWLSHLVPYPPKGGVLQRAYNLIKEVSKTHQIFLLAFNQSHLLQSSFVNSNDPLQYSVQHLSEICEEIKIIEIPSERLKWGKHRLALSSLFSPKGYTVEWLSSIKMSQAIEKWKNRYNFDLVHYDTISLAQYHYLLSELPSTLDHHNIESDMLYRRAKNEKNILKKIYFKQEAYKIRRYESNYCPKFNLNIVCSDNDLSSLAQHSSKIKSIVIPNGVDTDYFVPQQIEKEPKSLIFAGGLSWYPNLDAMLFFAYQIWPTLKRKIPDIKMNLIGRNPPQDLIEIGKNDHNFRVMGFVDDVRYYLATSEIYVCPIRDGGGTKLKILDALAMKCPLVVHPFACKGLVIENNKNVLLAETPNQFVHSIETILNDDSLKKTLGENGRVLVKNKYSFQQIGSKLSKAFTKVNNGEEDFVYES